MSATNYQKRKKSQSRRQQANIDTLRMTIADLRESMKQLCVLAIKSDPAELGAAVRDLTAQAENDSMDVAIKYHCYRKKPAPQRK